MSDVAGGFGSIEFASAQELSAWVADQTTESDAAVLQALGEAGCGAEVASLFPTGRVAGDVYSLATRGEEASLNLMLSEESLSQGALDVLAAVAAAARHGGRGQLVLFVGTEVTHELQLAGGVAKLRKAKGKPLQARPGFEAFVAFAAAAVAAPEPAPRVAPAAKSPKIRPLPWTVDVRYTASAKPQRVEVLVQPKGPATNKYLRENVEYTLRMLSMGGGGSDVFAPELGAGSLDKISKSKEGGFALQLTVTAMAPIFLRLFIDLVDRGCRRGELAHVRIVGENTSSGPKTDTAEVMRWLESPSAYGKLWPEPLPFAVEHAPMVRDSLKRPVSYVEATTVGPKAAVLTDVLACAKGAVEWRQATDGTREHDWRKEMDASLGTMDFHPAFAGRKQGRVLGAIFSPLFQDPVATWAQFANMLRACHLSSKKTRIERVQTNLLAQ